MKRPIRVLGVCGFVAAGALGYTSCAPQFNPQSELSGLRVMAVQKSEPYARPGAEVNLRMLWHDSADEGSRAIQIFWIAGCYNPPGDLFALCFTEDVFGDLPLARAPLGGVESSQVTSGDAGLGSDAGRLDAGATDAPLGGLEGAPTLSIPVPEAVLRSGDFPVKVGYGETFSFRMPDRVISARPPSPNDSVPPYGISYVFFAACAGEVRLEPGAAFPLACYDGERRLGSEDFVAGYTAVYSYADSDFENNNPSITGLLIDGEQAAVDCIGSQCSGLIPPSSAEAADCDDSNTLRLCPDDGECDKVSIKPLIDQSEPAETDSVLSAIRGTDFAEQMWINYYIDRGELGRDLRLLNDAQTGWNSDFGAEYLPKEPGTAYLWAVAHDNRGGAQWLRTRVCIDH